MGVDFSKSHRAMDAQQHKDSYAAFNMILVSGCVIVLLTLIGMAVVIL